MILSKCCDSSLNIVETPESSYYVCAKCNLPTEAYMALISAMQDNELNTMQEVKGVENMNLLDTLKKHVGKSLLIPTIISAANFLGLFLASISDGDIDDVELHNLISAGSGIELFVLVIAMAILKLRSKQ